MRPRSPSAYFRKIGLRDLARLHGPELGVVHERSLGPVRVPVPPLRFGRTFLDHWAVREEPAGVSWREDAYESMSPAVFSIRNALVHSSAGIACVGAFVAAETLALADPGTHGFEDAGDGILIAPADAGSLTGTHLSALTGAGANHYHMLVDGIGRLSAAAPATATGVLYPAGAPTAAHDALCGRWGARPVAVATGASLQVETLILAPSAHGQCAFHPSLADLFRDVLTPALLRHGAAQPPACLPRAFYVSRAAAQARRLVNEGAVTAALQAIGIVPVVLEGMTLADQASLFAGAELIVAPHGAGLANLLFARPGCAVLELQMDAHCSWCYRRLSAVLGLRYDCVVGRGNRPWADLPHVHGMTWNVSVPHVVSAARTMLARSAVSLPVALAASA